MYIDPEGKYEALDKYGNDLTELARRGKLDPVIGQDEDDTIRRCIELLSWRMKNRPGVSKTAIAEERMNNCPVIIGGPGAGKNAIAEGYVL